MCMLLINYNAFCQITGAYFTDSIYSDCQSKNISQNLFTLTGFQTSLTIKHKICLLLDEYNDTTGSFTRLALTSVSVG